MSVFATISLAMHCVVNWSTKVVGTKKVCNIFILSLYISQLLL
jgi:hypothetical protein